MCCAFRSKTTIGLSENANKLYAISLKFGMYDTVANTNFSHKRYLQNNNEYKMGVLCIPNHCFFIKLIFTLLLDIFDYAF